MRTSSLSLKSGRLRKRVDLGVESNLPAKRSHHEIGAEVAVDGSKDFNLSGAQKLVAVTLSSLDFQKNIKCGQTCRRNCNCHCYLKFLAALEGVSAKEVSG